MAAGGTALFQIFLVVLFGAIKFSCGRDFRGDGTLEFPAGV
jgi:hypothetical protein